MNVHPTAVIGSGASLGAHVSVGPFAIIEEGVTLGDGCVISGHAQLLGDVTIGAETHVGSSTVIGGPPQDLGFDPKTQSGVRIGTRCQIREHVTIHRSTSEGGSTSIGDRNYLMAGAHVGHDCQMGHDNTLANQCLLGGHVELGSHTFLGGGAAIHQFVRIGDHVMAQGHMGSSLDIPPFVMASGVNMVTGLNSVGLRRAGFNAEERAELKTIFKLFYREEKPLREAIREANDADWGDRAKQFLEFMEAPSRKGVCMRSRLR